MNINSTILTQLLERSSHVCQVKSCLWQMPRGRSLIHMVTMVFSFNDKSRNKSHNHTHSSEIKILHWTVKQLKTDLAIVSFYNNQLPQTSCVTPIYLGHRISSKQATKGGFLFSFPFLLFARYIQGAMAFDHLNWGICSQFRPKDVNNDD